MAQVGPFSGITLKQSTPYTRAFFFGTATQTCTVSISKAGGTFSLALGTVSEIASGWYKIAFPAGDLNTPGDLSYHVTAGAGGPLDFSDVVQSQIFTDLLLTSGNVSITSNIKKNQALAAFEFVMTINKAPAVGLSVTANRSLDGGGFAACANPPREIGNGVYAIDLAASDLNANVVMLRMFAAGADDQDILLLTQP